MANLSSAPVLLEVTSRTPAILSTSFSRRRIPVKRVANSCWPNTPPPPLNSLSLSPSLPRALIFGILTLKKKRNKKISGVVQPQGDCQGGSCMYNWNVHAKDGSRTDGRAWKQVSLVKIDEGGRRVFFKFFFPPFFLLLLLLHLRVEKTRRRRRRRARR